MKNNLFIGRKSELQKCANLINSAKYEIILLYGRRQIGKTTLLKEIVQKYQKQNILSFYFVADKTSFSNNLKRFSTEITQFLIKLKIEFKDLYSLFQFIFQEIKEQKFILVIDEFPYLQDTEKSINTVFQNIIDDHNFKNSQIKLFISGSDRITMEEIDQYHKPFYGRITSRIKLLPFDYQEAAEFYPSSSLENKIILYSIFGGLPNYLRQIDDSQSIADNIINVALSDNYLTPEAEKQIILPPEIQNKSEPYIEIINTISDKKLIKLNEISKKIGKTSSNTANLLKKLTNLNLVQKIVNFGEKEKIISKKTYYRIQESFIKFYYLFIKGYTLYQNNIYDLKNKKNFYQNYIDEKLSKFVSQEFEEICQNFLKKQTKNTYIQEIAPFLYHQHNHHIEIDIMLRTQQEILAFECKWSKNIIDQRMMIKLETKMKSILEISFFKNKHIKLGFFAKNGYEKQLKEKNPNYLYYQLEDLYF